jgi:hypothetical protein
MEEREYLFDRAEFNRRADRHSGRHRHMDGDRTLIRFLYDVKDGKQSTQIVPVFLRLTFYPGPDQISEG